MALKGKDRGPDLDGVNSVDAIAAFTLNPEHEKARLAHVTGLPLICLNEDSAAVTSSLLTLQLDREGEHRELPNQRNGNITGGRYLSR
ncbi:hypothetical protein SODG_002068 [Sodalis praecaptivus]